MARRMWCTEPSFGRSERTKRYAAQLDKQNLFMYTRRIHVGLHSSRPRSVGDGVAVWSKSKREGSEPSDDEDEYVTMSALDKANNEHNKSPSDESNEKRGGGGVQLTPLPKRYVFCPLCGRGRGVMICQKCRGKGVVLTRPGGAGVAGVVGKARCSICNGVGKVSCLLCGGNESCLT